MDDADACYGLALLVQEHTQIGDSGSQALFLRACKLEIVSGCTNWAAGLAELKPNDKAAQKCTTDTFEMACDREDPWACTMFGLALSEGLGRDKNIRDALRALDRACEVSFEKDGPACKKGRELRDAILRIQELEKKSIN